MNTTTAGTFADVWSSHWLPAAPLAGDVKTLNPHLHRHSRQVAMTMPYLEANPLALRSLVIIDHDGSDADLIAGLLGLPQPSYIAMNPYTRAGHIAYALDSPVTLTDAARRRPINLLARIEQGLTDVLGGDVAYGGRITKNPYHGDHRAIWGDIDTTYGLRELASALDALGALPGPGRPRQNLVRSTIGRNVALFDLIRHWAYRARLQYVDRTEWEEVVYAYAHDRNLSVIADEFTRGPLVDGEVKQLARSVARWVWRNFSVEQFAAIQSARARKGGRTITDQLREANRRRATKLDRLLAAKEL
jgi:hypothetical protein